MGHSKVRLRLFNISDVTEVRVLFCILAFGSIIVTTYLVRMVYTTTTDKLISNLDMFKGLSVSQYGSHYVCISGRGRLGNHLFQYASLYGIARKNNRTILVQEDSDIVSYFNLSSAKVIHNAAVCRSFKRIYEEKCCTYDPSLTSLPGDTDYVIGDYLQSWRYFEEYFSEIRRELTLKPPIHNPARVTVDGVRGGVSCGVGVTATTVGVHVRLGDALEPVQVRLGYNVVPEGYIQRAVDYYIDRFPCVLFIVCSEGTDYVRRIFRYRNVSVVHIRLSAIEDFAILASCDHVIITTGSFGWWVGFLSGGSVVYYKYPIREGLVLRQMFNYDDYFLPSWIGLP